MSKDVFDRLAEQKKVIEAEFGEELEWERVDDRVYSLIGVYRKGHIEWSNLEEIRKWHSKKLRRLKKVFTRII